MSLNGSHSIDSGPGTAVQSGTTAGGNSAHYDVCVVGAGSGGFGAAVSAARHGARVLLIEASDGLGGTSTWAGVNNWEPVAGPTGLPQELYGLLRRQPDAVALQRRIPWPHPNFRGAYMVAAPETDYRLSLSRRSGMPIAFEPAALDAAMAETLATLPNCDVWLKTRFVDVQCEAAPPRGAGDAGRRVAAIRVVGEAAPEGRWVTATTFVDASADLYLARAAGCETRIGPEPRSLHGEPAAPDEDSPAPRLNNASLCYRVARLAPGEARVIQSPPDGVDLETVRASTSIRSYPNGDLNMNPVGLLLGLEAFSLFQQGGPAAAYAEAERRVYAHWHVLQTRCGFEDWKLTWLSPFLGVRETHRLVARTILREQDCRAGLVAQEAARCEGHRGDRGPFAGLPRQRPVDWARARWTVRYPVWDAAPA